MHSLQLSVETTRAAVADWRELASRESDGLAVSLYWSKSSARVKVDVVDQRSEQAFEFDVDVADALSAFYHPFAYAPNESLFTSAMRDSVDHATTELKRSER